MPTPAKTLPDLIAAPMRPELHPIRPAYPTRYLELVDRVLAGRRASGAFRDPLSDLQVRWTLEQWGQGPGVLEDRSEEDARTLTLLAAGMSMAGNDLLTELLQEVPVLYSAHRTLRTLSSPSLRIGGSQDRKVALGGADRDDRNDSMARAAMEQNMVRRPPSLRTGTGLLLRGPTPEEEQQPLADVAAYVVADRIVVDSWRLSGLVLEQSWSAVARQEIVRGWHLTLSGRSLQSSPLLASYVAGTITELPGPWQWRNYLHHRLSWPDQQEEIRVGVELRALWRWRAPQRPGGWGLGDRPSYAGPEVPGSRRWDRAELVQLYDPPQPPAAEPSTALSLRD